MICCIPPGSGYNPNPGSPATTAPCLSLALVVGICMMVGLVAATVLYWGMPVGFGTLAGACLLLIAGCLSYVILNRNNHAAAAHQECGCLEVLIGILSGCFCFCCTAHHLAQQRQ